MTTKQIWLTILHLVLIGAGTYVSVQTGTPIPLAVTSAVNAIAKSPIGAGSKGPTE